MKRTRIQKYYNTIVVEDLLILYNCSSIVQLPQMKRAILNISSKKFLIERQNVVNALTAAYVLTGQKGALTRAQKSIAAFSIRKSSPIGCVVTVRKDRMYALLDKVITFALPRLQNQWNQLAYRPAIETIYRKRTAQSPLQNPSLFDTSDLVSRIEGTRDFAQDSKAQALNASWNSPLSAPSQSSLTRLQDWSLRLHLRREELQKRKNGCVDYGIKDVTIFPEMEKLSESNAFLQGLNMSFSFSAHRLEGQKTANSVTEHTKPQQGWNEKAYKRDVLYDSRLTATSNMRAADIEKQKDLLFLSAFQHLYH